LDDIVSYAVLYSTATRYFVLLVEADSGNMPSTTGSPQMEQQRTTLSLPTETGENNLSFSIDTSMLCSSSSGGGGGGEQKATTDTTSIEWPHAEFSQNDKASIVSQVSIHSVQSDQDGPDGHPGGHRDCLIDPGSSHCGSRPVIYWLGYDLNSVSFTTLLQGSLPSYFDHAPNFVGTYPFPTTQITTSPCLRLPGDPQHNGQNTHVTHVTHFDEPCQDLRQSPNLSHGTQGSSNLGLGHLQTSIPRRKFKCSLSGCGSHFNRRKSLTRHLANHSGDRRYVCWVPGCRRNFSRRDNLNAHYKTHGNRGGRNRYVATLDKTSPVYNPDFCGQLTPEGWPLD